METHLDALLSKYRERRSLSYWFLESRRNYLILKLSELQKLLDAENIGESVSFLFLTLYIFYFLKKEVGRLFKPLLDFLKLYSSWPLDLYSILLKARDLNEQLYLLLQIYSETYNIPDSQKKQLASEIKRLWRKFGLSSSYEEKLEQVYKRKLKEYNSINTYPEQIRRGILNELFASKEKGILIRLANIGIVPTELCPNFCRFCLAPLKLPVEERLGRSIDFHKIADQVINFAGRNQLAITITGGEPFLELKRTLYIVENANCRVDLITSAYWAESTAKTENLLRTLSDSVNSNSNSRFSFNLQVSLDAYHQEIRERNGQLYENIPLERIINLVKISAAKFPEIELCLLTKYTVCYDPLVRLIRELEHDGWRVELTSRKYDPEFLVPVLSEDFVLVFKPGLMKANLELTNNRLGVKRKSILVYYTAIEKIGRAEALEDIEFPTFKAHLRKFLADRDYRESLPLIGLEVSDDGNVYPSAHALYGWSLGNLLVTPLDALFKRLSYDPLVIAMVENPRKLLEIASEVENVNVLIRNASSPLAAIYSLLNRAALRLYLTKRLIMEDEAYSSSLKSKLGLNVPIRKLKEEYLKLKSRYE